MEAESHSRRRRGIIFWIILLVILGAGAWALSYFKLLPSTSDYQAVFLNNGQVYFGKLSYERSQFPVLRGIYYLQITQPIQPGEANDTPANINLVKLGEELHGPTDEMRINRDSIIFVEDLRDDSRVVQAIKQLKQ